MKRFNGSINLLVSMCFLALSPLVSAQEGVKKESVQRPTQEKAKVEGCKISRTGNLEVNVGDLIELEYTYPIVPGATPKKVDFHQTLLGVLKPSPLGFRNVNTGNVGSQTIAFFFDAVTAGEETVYIVIDDQEYIYMIKVVSLTTTAKESETAGVKGTILQPKMVDAKVNNCKISDPSSYKVKVGDIIQLSYQFPVALPPPETATPKEVSIAIPKIAPPPVLESSLGIRNVIIPGLAGGAQIRAYLIAQNPGKTSVSFFIDKDEYKYSFDVSK